MITDYRNTWIFVFFSFFLTIQGCGSGSTKTSETRVEKKPTSKTSTDNQKGINAQKPMKTPTDSELDQHSNHTEDLSKDEESNYSDPLDQLELAWEPAAVWNVFKDNCLSCHEWAKDKEKIIERLDETISRISISKNMPPNNRNWAMTSEGITALNWLEEMKDLQEDL